MAMALFTELVTPNPVLRIRIRIWIRIFLGLLDPVPDTLVRGMDPDPGPSIMKQN